MSAADRATILVSSIPRDAAGHRMCLAYTETPDGVTTILHSFHWACPYDRCPSLPLFGAPTELYVSAFAPSTDQLDVHILSEEASPN